MFCGSPAFRGGGVVRILGSSHSFTCWGEHQAQITGHRDLLLLAQGASGLSHHPVPPYPLRSHLLNRMASRTAPPSPRYNQAEAEPRHSRPQAEPDANQPQPSPRREDAGAVGPAAQARLHTFACDLHVINFMFKACPSPHAGGPPRTSSWVRPGSPRPRAGRAAQPRASRRIPAH